MPQIPPDIAKLFASKIASSGISRKQAGKLKFTLSSPSETSKANLPACWAIKLPYFDGSGRQTKFFRYRFLEDTRSAFDRQTDKKPMRYGQVSGTVNEIYLPPILKWEDIGDDTRLPLIITEGELKAACASTRGIACVGLGGVWCFRSTAENLHLIPAMNWIDWKDREVFILFDSDAAVNPDIAAAENALAMTLTELGARPWIARMPKLAGQDKTGLDDFIMKEGHEKVDKLLGEASSFKAASMLHEFNEKVVFVRNPGFIVKLANYQKMTRQMFIDTMYANKKFTQTEETRYGLKMVVKSAPREWMGWSLRAEVEKLAYAPGKPRIHNDMLNVWPGWRVQPKAGDVTPWKKLLDYLFHNETEARDWFEQWISYPLQHPGTKLYTTAVLWGVHTGTGKSLIAYTVKCIYGTNFTEIEEENLGATHNEWAENKQFILGDDVTGKEQRGYADKLKGMITRQILRLNPKFIPAYEVDDCINYYFTSNQPDAFFLEDKDRRFFVHEVKQKPMPREFYEEYDTWYRNDDGAAALFDYLLKINTSKFNPKAPALMTDSKMQMIEDVRSDLSGWVHRMKLTPDLVLRKNGEPVEYDFYRTEDILKLYDPMSNTKVTVATMARELKRANIERACGGQQCPTQNGQLRLWVVRNSAKYLYVRPCEAGQQYEKERGECLEVKEKKPVGFKRKKHMGGGR